MTTEPLTPAQQEQRDYERGQTVLAIRDEEFRRAPAYIPQEGEWGALKEFARSLCITEFVPKEMRGRPFAVLGALLMGRELGVPPMSALRRIPVINGRPSMETAVKVALVRQKGHRVRVIEWDAEHCTVEGWRKGDPADELMQVTYTMDDARAAGDYNKPGANNGPGVYKTRPRQMMYARAAGLLCDTYFSDVTLGIPDVEEAAALPAEVIEGRLAEMDRRGELPEMPTDTALTDEERAQVEEKRQEEAKERLAGTPPPPPPRTRGRGRGPKPNPQQGSDSGGRTEPSAAAPAGSPAAAATPAPATAAADPELVSKAQMARDLGLDEIAEALERGEHVPDGWERLGAAERAATPPEAPAATPTTPPAAEAPQRQGAPAEDPFADEPAPIAENVHGLTGLLRLRKQGLDYAVFLTRRKLERDGRPASGTDQLEREALARLDQVSKQMLSHPWAEATEAELEQKLVPWLRQRYGAEGGAE